MLKGNQEPAWLPVCVCILTYNRDHLLRPLLDELKRQLRPVDQVLVLDTGSSDVTKQLVAALESDQIRYHTFQQEHFDFATARNKLLSLAAGNAVAFIDDDAYPFPNWLDQIRRGLQNHDAAGGVTIADGDVPQWWVPEINWCIGLSPPGTVLRVAGYYPDTCNMAANGALWTEHRFDVIRREARQLYATGREDAEWWMDRRLMGADASVNFRQAVTHHVHSDRLTWTYVKQRARNDGVSSWLRRPNYDAATAIPWDLAHIAGVVADKVALRPFDAQHRLADVVWMQRQWGKFMAVWQSPVTVRPRRREQVKQLAKAAVFQANIRAGKAVFLSRNILRHRGIFPPSAPRSIFVSAECFLGDSVLLRRHIQTLAVSFQNSTILVSCKYPALLQGLGDNVNAVPTSVASKLVRGGGEPVDAAIIPYFPFGDYRLWRAYLSQIGTTFNCDVGFSGRRDYLYARHTVYKNMELHEHENLARLFRLWPLRPTVKPHPPSVAEEDIEWAQRTLITAGITGEYILVQFGAGHESKEWPLDQWIPFLKEIAVKIGLPIVITGGLNWKEAGDIAVREVKLSAGMLCTIGDTAGQMMALVRSASYFIGGCSGPKHLAMAFDVPTFTLYAASEPQRWGAVENHHLHGYANALPQKLSGMELQGLSTHHRIRLLQAEVVADKAVRHFKSITPLGR